MERLRADRRHAAARVTFWGTRGSIPAPGPSTTLYGGNTACVELRSGPDILIFDAGTGIRELGLALAEEFRGRALTIHLFISHTHWDHIQGFPFFVPPTTRHDDPHLRIAGQGRSLKGVLSGQMHSDYFPVALGDLIASLHVHEYRGEPFRIGDATISATYLNHPGDGPRRTGWSGPAVRSCTRRTTSRTARRSKRAAASRSGKAVRASPRRRVRRAS